MIRRPCNFTHHKLLLFQYLPYFSEQLLDDSFGNSGQTVSDPKNNLTATQPSFNESNRIRPSLNPKRPDDGSVKGVSPPPEFLEICTTISGHDLFASPINKNLGAPRLSPSPLLSSLCQSKLLLSSTSTSKAPWQAAATKRRASDEAEESRTGARRRW
jgi:hypothetical protein